MSNPVARVLFLGKANDAQCQKALSFCQGNFAHVTACLGAWGDPFPETAAKWEGDVIISYRSRWIVPGRVLSKAAVAALNFHPAPPQYPGVGGYNFALYDGATSFGVTCHHMVTEAETGGLVAVDRFPVLEMDDAATLATRAHDHLLVLFYKIVSRLTQREELPASEEAWARSPYTRKEFNELNQIRPDMDEDEIARRIRATGYGSWKPVVRLAGYRFELEHASGR